MFYQLVRTFFFGLEAESAHELSLTALRSLPIPASNSSDPVLKQVVAGIDFPNPVGLAPGYDKNAEVVGPILKLGFGFTEVGTLTPRPQAGNPHPRLFRLTQDRGVINRMGFNNEGQAAAIERLKPLRKVPLPGPLGINIGANKDSEDRIADYSAGVAAMEPFADYLTINISSPNTPGLRALQDKDALDMLLSAALEQRKKATPVFLKVAPDLEPDDIDDIVDMAHKHALAAIIVSNTTISRPPLKSGDAGQAGGLSGAPLAPLALQRLRDFRKASGGKIPLVGVGGIESGEDAYERIRAGASLIQLYSALVYEGAGLPRRICRELAALLKADGFSNVAEAVGVE